MDAKFAPAIERANRWLRGVKPANTLETATLLLALPDRKDLASALRAIQTSDGGWGPLPHTPAEAFDTAVVLLALQAAGETAPIERGRSFLLSIQQPGGGWPETTRPAGQLSYAEHISTSGWALYALLMTDPKRQ
jgi:hypothetical protein